MHILKCHKYHTWQILSNVIKLHILAKQTICHIFFVICRSCKYDDEIYPCHMIMPGNNSSGVILEVAATASSHCVFWIQKQIHLLGLLSQESKFFFCRRLHHQPVVCNIRCDHKFDRVAIQGLIIITNFTTINRFYLSSL